MTTNENDPKVWKKVPGGAVLKVVLVLLAIFWLIIVAASWAESAEFNAGMPQPIKESAASDDSSTDVATPMTLPELTTKAQRAPASVTPIEDDSSDEYNFSWLDPEKKIYVLQNRKYLKAGHVFLNLMGGPGLSNSYRSVWNLDPRVDFYFSESFGIEMFYTFTFNSPNNTYQALNNQSGGTVLPIVREVNSELGFMGQWVPWYAKINVFNKIIYFDWYFQGGLGQLGTTLVTQTNTTQPFTTTPQNLFALYDGTGLLFHLSQQVTFRVDFTGAYYHAPLQGNAGASTWFSNYNFEIGFGYRL